MGGSFGDLLTRLGFVRPHGYGQLGDQHQYEHGRGHGHGHDHVLGSAVTHHSDHAEHKEWKVIKAWKHHIAPSPSRESVGVEGGVVRILPFTELEEDHAHGRHGGGHQRYHGHGLRPHGGHHWHQSSFAGRYVLSLLPSSPHPYCNPLLLRNHRSRSRLRRDTYYPPDFIKPPQLHLTFRSYFLSSSFSLHHAQS
jgi:hypothetical protein